MRQRIRNSKDRARRPDLQSVPDARAFDLSFQEFVPVIGGLCFSVRLERAYVSDVVVKRDKSRLFARMRRDAKRRRDVILCASIHLLT